MKRKHLLFKEAVCKNRISLIKLFVNRNLSLNFPLNIHAEIISKSKIKPHEWKRYTDDVFCLWDKTREARVRCKTYNNILLFYPFVQDANDSFVPCFAFVLCIMTSAVPFYMDHKPEIDQFIVEANRHHSTIKFTAEISDKETHFLDTTIFKGERFHKDSILDISTHFKPTEKFQYTHYTSCHAPEVKKGFIKGKRSGFLEPTLRRQDLKKIFVTYLRVRGYPDYLVNNVLAEVKFTNRRSALEQKPQRVQSGLMTFVTQYNSSVPNLKNILMSKWHLIENQPLLTEIYREPPFICLYRKGKSLKDILVGAKL